MFATLVTFFLLDGPEIIRKYISGPASSVSEQPASEGSALGEAEKKTGRLEIRKDAHFMGLTDWDVYFVSGSVKVLLFENLYNTDEVALSPGGVRAVALTPGIVNVANVDGSSRRQWGMQAGPSNLDFGRPLVGLAFVDDSTIRCQIELMENDASVGVRLGGVSLDGSGVYEIEFDEYNYVTSARLIR